MRKGAQVIHPGLTDLKVTSPQFSMALGLMSGGQMRSSLGSGKGTPKYLSKAERPRAAT